MKVFLYADGGSRGNPGVAGSGALLIDAETKKQLASIVYAFEEKASNNVAEYRGLVEGLRAARQVGASEVYVFMDSKLVVEQMTGRWKIKHPAMQELALEAKNLATGLARVTYQWVPRAQNKEADALSNVAMDASAAGAPTGIVVEKSQLPKTGTQDESVDVSPAPTAPRYGEKRKRTRLVLLRHGETHMSVAGQYAGHEDAVLTERGLKQAAAAADAIGGDYEIDAIYSSPLSRCADTAEALRASTGLSSVHRLDALIECDFGNFEGLTFPEAEAQHPELHQQWLKNPSTAPPEGESLDQVSERVLAAVDEIVEKHRGETVALVTHVNPIKSIVVAALGGDTSMFARMFLDVAATSVVDVADGASVSGARLRVFNDHSYLRVLGLETPRD